MACQSSRWVDVRGGDGVCQCCVEFTRRRRGRTRRCCLVLTQGKTLLFLHCSINHRMMADDAKLGFCRFKILGFLFKYRVKVSLVGIYRLLG